MASEPTVLIVPGLREHVAEHWQTHLAARLPRVRTVPPMGRQNLERALRVEAIERELSGIDGPVILVAHSAGVMSVVHWALWGQRPIHGALLATPPDFEEPMPDAYPAMHELWTGGWLPVPRGRLPFPSIVTASQNDPLGRFERVAGLARGWGSRMVDLGTVGHLNPASGFGDWPQADELIRQLH